MQARATAFGAIIALAIYLTIRLTGAPPPTGEGADGTPGLGEVSRGKKTWTLDRSRHAAELTQNEYDALAFPDAFDPGLATIVSIGDSVSVDYARDLRRNLKGEANVFRANANCGSGHDVVASYDAWIEFLQDGVRGRWGLESFTADGVFVNFGLHDGVIYVRKSFRDATERQDYFDRTYRPGLRDVIRKIRANSVTATATIVFVNTTPLNWPEDENGGRGQNVRVMNALADEVMGEQGAEVLDAFGAVAAEMESGKVFHRDHLHFNAEGSAFMARLIADYAKAGIASNP